MSFGDYLIEKGKIDRTDLDVALKLKTEKGIRLGVMVVDDGLLTEQQLGVILHHQKQVANVGLFGEIVINMKFLSREQVNTLLKKQKEYEKIVNQVLVLSGSVSNNEKEEELKQFYNMIPKNN